MYAQNPMFSDVSPGRMAEARRFAQGGQMGRAKQQFELGGGQWNPQVQGMIGQQDNIGQMIPGPPQGGTGGPPPGIDRWNPGGPPRHVQPGFATGGPDDPAMGGSGYTTPGMGGTPKWGAFPGFGGGMGGGMGSPPMPPPQFGGRPPAGANMYAPAVMPGYGAGGGGPVKAVMPQGWDQPGSPNYRPPGPSWEQRLGGGGFGGGMPGGFGGRPPAGPPDLRRRMSMY